LRDEAYLHADNLVSSHVGDVPIIEQDLTSPRRGESNDGSNESCLSHPISPQKGDNRFFGNLQTDPLENIAIAVISMNIQNLEHRTYSEPK
jgi:hypothetical protein